MFNLNELIENTNNQWLVWVPVSRDLTDSLFDYHEIYNNINSLFITFEFNEIRYHNSFICLTKSGYLILLDEKFTSGKDGKVSEGLTLYLAKSSEDVTPLSFTQEDLSQLLKIIKVQSDKNPFNQ